MLDGHFIFWNVVVWAAAMAGVAGEFLLPLVLGRFYPSYHLARDGLGKLSNPRSPVAWPYRGFRFLMGVLSILLGIGFFFGFSPLAPLALRIALLVLCILYGIGGCLIPSVLSVVDIYDVEWMPAKVYAIANTIGRFALQLSSLCISMILCFCGQYGLGAGTILSTLVAILLYSLSVMSHRKEFQGTILQYTGLWEMAFLAACYISWGIAGIWILIGVS